MRTLKNWFPIYLLLAVLLSASTGGAQPVTKIAAGQSHSLFLKNDGSLWAMGNNDYGQLGDGTFKQTNSPELIVRSNVTAIAAGAFHSLFLKNDGSLWGMGLDYWGQLGCGPYTYIVNGTLHLGTNRPEQIVASDVTAVAGGAAHSLFLKSDGSLWSMGYNAYGQLGDGTTIDTNHPEQIVASNVTAIAAGVFHSLFLKSDGSLWAVGDNEYGQLGIGLATNRCVPVQIVASNVIAIAAELADSLFLLADGSLWGMGLNSVGELGDGTTNRSLYPELIVASNVVSIAAGKTYSLFSKVDGSLWAMGDNGYGQTNFGVNGDYHFSTNRPIQLSLQAAKTFASGTDHSLFLKHDGSLWGMGLNSSGQLGDGTTNNVSQPKLILGAFNQLDGQPLGDGKMELSFVGVANTDYALDRSPNLSTYGWTPVVTNTANSLGILAFTNAPDPATENFWRIRSVP